MGWRKEGGNGERRGRRVVDDGEQWGRKREYMGERQIQNSAWEDKEKLLIEGYTVNGLRAMEEIGERRAMLVEREWLGK